MSPTPAEPSRGEILLDTPEARPRRLRWPLAAMGALTLTAIGIAVAQPARPTTPGAGAPKVAVAVDAKAPAFTSKIDYRLIDARIGELMQQRDMVGLAVAIVEGGEIRFAKGYGVTQAGGSDPVTTATVFRWASLSKGVAGTLVAELDRAHLLSLNAPVSRYGTSLRLPGGSEAQISVRDLLSHRVGIVRNAYDDRLEDGQDPRAIRASLAELPPYCPPASCYAYQNIAFDAAHEIVERTTRKSYGDTANALLFRPLGMVNASVGRAGLEGAASWARPHRRNRQMVALKDAYYHVPAAGGVNSSIFDLARWMQAQMGKAPGILPPELLDALHAPLVPTPPHGARGPVDRALAARFYGLGWRDYEYVGHHPVGHRGAVDGYRSAILFDPQADAGIVLLWNSHSEKPVGLQLEVMDMVYGLPHHQWVEMDEAKPGTAVAPAGQTGRGTQ